MRNRKINIKLLKTNKGIKGLKINSLLHTNGQQITLNIKKNNEEQCKMVENRGYGGNLPDKYFPINFSLPRET